MQPQADISVLIKKIIIIYNIKLIINSKLSSVEVDKSMDASIAIRGLELVIIDWLIAINITIT